MSSEATAGQEPDVYGQLHPVETDELLEDKKKEIDDELSKLPQEKKTEWMEAKEKCPPSLVGDDFKLKFLRCEVFNADVSMMRQKINGWTDGGTDGRIYQSLTHSRFSSFESLPPVVLSSIGRNVWKSLDQTKLFYRLH